MIGLSADDAVSRLASELGLTGLDSVHFRVCTIAAIYQSLLNIKAHPDLLLDIQRMQSKALADFDQLRSDMPDLFDHD